MRLKHGKLHLFIRNLATGAIHELQITTENQWEAHTRYGGYDLYALYPATETDQLRTRASVQDFVNNRGFALSIYNDAWERDLGQPTVAQRYSSPAIHVGDELVRSACGWYEVEKDLFEVLPSPEGGWYARMPDGQPINPGWVIARGRPARAPDEG